MEQRCRNRFSPRVPSSLSLAAPGATAEGLFWALNCAKQPTEAKEKASARTMFNLIFKMSFRLPSNAGTRAEGDQDATSVLRRKVYCQEIRYAIWANIRSNLRSICMDGVANSWAVSSNFDRSCGNRISEQQEAEKRIAGTYS
jgi:hypothetical protein